MPPQFGANHRKLKDNPPPSVCPNRFTCRGVNNGPSCNEQKFSNPNLEGWGGIEDVMFTNDKAQMDDNSDDIDTLLIFVSPQIFWYTDSVVCGSDERVRDM